MMNAGMINPLFLAPFYAYQAKYIKAVWEFKTNEGSINSSKKLKRTAYTPFILLLAGFMISTGYNRHQKRKENKELFEQT
jgi:hypothetical protein